MSIHLSVYCRIELIGSLIPFRKKIRSNFSRSKKGLVSCDGQNAIGMTNELVIELWRLLVVALTCRYISLFIVLSDCFIDFVFSSSFFLHYLNRTLPPEDLTCHQPTGLYNTTHPSRPRITCIEWAERLVSVNAARPWSSSLHPKRASFIDWPNEASGKSVSKLNWIKSNSITS